MRNATAAPPPETLLRAFARTRRQLGIEVEFPADVEEEAGDAARRTARPGPERADLRALPFCTIDPPGSRDLDQAVHAERAGDGYRVRYAIADVSFFVDRGGALEGEAWKRGVTYYAPDARAPLYPPVLCEGAASLLADADRPAIVFDLRLGPDAELVGFDVARALVRNRAQLTFGDLLRQVDQGIDASADASIRETLRLVGEVGRLRTRREAERGGVSLPIRDQHIQQTAATRLGYELVYEEPNEAERWNAQISLLTGHGAARRMLDAGVGILRVMPPFRQRAVEKFRRIARTLGFPWPRGVAYPEFMRGLDPSHPNAPMLVWQARRVMGGAGYRAFHGGAPDDAGHAALAMAYAHVTAPLRRLADRYALDLLVGLCRGQRPDDRDTQVLAALPPVMEAANRKEHRLQRRVVDMAEAWVLRGRVGECFTATVLESRRGRAEIELDDPAVRTTMNAPENGLEPETRVTVRLTAVDPEKGRVVFVPAET